MPVGTSRGGDAGSRSRLGMRERAQLSGRGSPSSSACGAFPSRSTGESAANMVVEDKQGQGHRIGAMG
ncbi:hypothetical protein B0H19DRAFT_311125 [Mycena capillaripes]|nr:hypothetical protein B0H19DRAFT_311125 [Mycena capillaripes]